MRFAPAALLIGLFVAFPAAAGAAELHVIAAAPTTGIVKELGARFERETGHRLVARFVSGPVVQREIDAGAAFDVAVSITPVIDALVKEGKLAPGSRAAVAYAGLGVGVRRGAAKPDISTVEAFKRALLDAASVAHSAEGASGTYFNGLLARLGIADAMKGKLRPMPASRIAQAVPSGEAEMIVVTLSVIVGSEAQLVGPIPAELQFYNSFAGGVSAQTKEPRAAAAFLELLTGPGAASVIKANGMEPGTPP